MLQRNTLPARGAATALLALFVGACDLLCQPAPAAAAADAAALAAASNVRLMYEAFRDGATSLSADDLADQVATFVAPGATLRISSAAGDPIAMPDFPAVVRAGAYTPFAGMRFCLPAASDIAFRVFIPGQEHTFRATDSVGGFVQWQSFVAATDSCGVAMGRYVFGEYGKDGLLTGLNDAINGDAMPALGGVMGGKCADDTSLPAVAEAQRALMQSKIDAFLRDIAQRGAEAFDGTHTGQAVSERASAFVSAMPPGAYVSTARNVYRFTANEAFATIDAVHVPKAAGKSDGDGCGKVHQYASIARFVFDGASGKIAEVDWYRTDADSAVVDSLIECGRLAAKDKKDEL